MRMNGKDDRIGKFKIASHFSTILTLFVNAEEAQRV